MLSWIFRSDSHQLDWQSTSNCMKNVWIFGASYKSQALGSKHNRNWNWFSTWYICSNKNMGVLIWGRMQKEYKGVAKFICGKCKLHLRFTREFSSRLIFKIMNMQHWTINNCYQTYAKLLKFRLFFSLFFSCFNFLRRDAREKLIEKVVLIFPDYQKFYVRSNNCKKNFKSSSSKNNSQMLPQGDNSVTKIQQNNKRYMIN